MPTDKPGHKLVGRLTSLEDRSKNSTEKRAVPLLKIGQVRGSSIVSFWVISHRFEEVVAALELLMQEHCHLE